MVSVEGHTELALSTDEFVYTRNVSRVNWSTRHRGTKALSAPRPHAGCEVESSDRMETRAGPVTPSPRLQKAANFPSGEIVGTKTLVMSVNSKMVGTALLKSTKQRVRVDPVTLVKTSLA
jgi:hypothetical protein